MFKEMYRHFKTVHAHRKIVREECVAVGIGHLGWKHDLSKYGFTEFIPSARYFQGTRSPIDAEKEDVGYSMAWLHHKGHNKHHWEWWTDFDKDGNVIAAKIPYNYVLEMVCDWIAAGKVYNKEKWTQATPLEYYEKVRAGRHFHPETEECLVRFLTLIKEEGLEGFHDREKRWPIEKDYKFKSILRNTQ